jgi:hypothetical protein
LVIPQSQCSQYLLGVNEEPDGFVVRDVIVDGMRERIAAIFDGLQVAKKLTFHGPGATRRISSGYRKEPVEVFVEHFIKVVDPKQIVVVLDGSGRSPNSARAGGIAGCLVPRFTEEPLQLLNVILREDAGQIFTKEPNDRIPEHPLNTLVTGGIIANHRYWSSDYRRCPLSTGFESPSSILMRLTGGGAPETLPPTFGTILADKYLCLRVYSSLFKDCHRICI